MVGRSLFPGLVLPVDVIDSESVADIKLGDAGVVTGYQINEYTHTWLAEHLVQKQIYPGFTGKASHLTCFPS